MMKKIYPTIEDCKVKNFVTCQEKDCTKVFKSDSNLNLHLAKTHGKKELLQNNMEKQYHCPELQCIYHQAKYMKNMKFLRQHYLKVHTKRDYSCNHCQRSFTSNKAFQSHLVYCGIKFSCCECTASYLSYETLQTHGRRKKHTILSKCEYTLKTVSPSEVPTVKKDEKFILPKTLNMIIISNSNMNKISQGQCYETPDNKKIIYKIKGKNNQQTAEMAQQTETTLKPTLLSVGTQTDERSNYKLGFSNVKNQKTTDTQTDFIESVKFSKKTAHNILVHEINTVMNSSSTQTCNDLNIYYTNDKIKCTVTNNPSSLMGDTTLNNNVSNFEFDNCHMETQTDFIFDDVMFSSDYLMSNMYTQTCDDYLNQFNFNDIQTQTVFDDDMIRSVESQTFMSPRLQSNYTCKDMSHTETQTDVEFRQMLEVINS